MSERMDFCGMVAEMVCVYNTALLLHMACNGEVVQGVAA